MLDCRKLDPLVTPYVDGELAPEDREGVDAHLNTCPPCRARVAAESSASHLVQTNRPELRATHASDVLRARCERVARTTTPAMAGAPAPRATSTRRYARTGPLALAAMLVLFVGGAFVYEATERSDHIMAAELAADHVKCFAMNAVLRTHEDALAVERSLADRFGWRVKLPDQPERMGLELVGERPCLYGEGKIAHLMYRHNGQPVSVFMLPGTTRRSGVVDVMGHQATIWSGADRTFVLIAREPPEAVAKMASFVQASLR